MNDPGLSNRLRHHSRRAGLMAGIAMALTIAICIGGFAVIYAGLIPIFSDIVPPGERDATNVSAPAPAVAQAQGVPTNTPGPDPAAAPTTVPPTTAAPPEPAAEPTATPDTFEPTHQINPGQSINLRPDPSTNNPPIIALPPQTPLQYLNEDAPASNPDDAPRWMRFRTEEGQEGWVRQIDTEPYQP